MIGIGQRHVSGEPAPIEASLEQSSELPIGAVDARMIGVMRCILAFAGLVIYNFYHVATSKFVTLTFASLIAYYVWSAVTLLWAMRYRVASPPKYEH